MVVVNSTETTPLHVCAGLSVEMCSECLFDSIKGEGDLGKC